MKTKVTEAAKHTPGPWKTDAWMIRGATLDPVAEVQTLVSEDEWEANARLIAASPDILVACRSFLSAIEGGQRGETSKARELVIAAIAKAEGR